MKQINTILISFLLTILFNQVNSQTISNFENFSLAANSYWNGSNLAGGFNSGNARFNNVYDTASGGNWSGWALSNKTDSVTEGYGNQYSVSTGIGFGASANYAVAFYSAFGGIPTIILNGTAAGKVAKGCWINNSAYAYWDMKKGSNFSKKFGGKSGTDSDYFKLTATGYKGGVALSNKINMMLADYTSSDSTKDYILKNWTWLDLSSFGNVDSIMFSLSSTDNGTFGMNTPSYFCLDNFITADQALNVANISEVNHALNIYPNPTASIFYTSIFGEDATLQIFDITGKLVKFEQTLNNSLIDISTFNAGIYMIQVSLNNITYTAKLIKE